MTARPILSILIPTRNRAFYLKYAIQSALNIADSNIEILVSENHSSDNSREVCAGFQDPRLTILRPQKPLPMHKNWELLLGKASGEWVYFLGDDDAIMPHAASHLQYLTEKYPQCEAIVSPRAYYFWPADRTKSDRTVKVSFGIEENWIDSKLQMRKCLEGKINYLDLPQLYSGGFQRRTLVNRVRNSQNNIYFKSVIPDAYSAVMGCAHTFRYLNIHMPLAWVGTSDASRKHQQSLSIKDRVADFWGMHDEDDLVMHRALGNLRDYTFTLAFFEAYISAIPTTSMWDLSMEKVQQLYLDSVKKFRASGNEKAVQDLGSYLGFSPPSLKLSKSEFLHSTIANCGRWISSRAGMLLVKLNRRLRKDRLGSAVTFSSIESNCPDQYPNILSCDEEIADAYSKWQYFGFANDHDRIRI